MGGECDSRGCRDLIAHSARPSCHSLSRAKMHASSSRRGKGDRYAATTVLISSTDSGIAAAPLSCAHHLITWSRISAPAVVSKPEPFWCGVRRHSIKWILDPRRPLPIPGNYLLPCGLGQILFQGIDLIYMGPVGFISNNPRWVLQRTEHEITTVR